MIHVGRRSNRKGLHRFTRRLHAPPKPTPTDGVYAAAGAAAAAAFIHRRRRGHSDG